MIVKLCGVKTKNNFKDLPKIPLDMIGLNFVPSSPRYVEDNQTMTYLVEHLPKEIKRVGVFVNEDLEEVEWRHASFTLDYIQLHGDEDLTYCTEAKKIGKLIKVFRIDKDFDFATTKPYESIASYFLFDTKTMDYGGSGEAFDWQLLDRYTGQKGFLLAGGIGPDDVAEVRKLKHPQLIGIDINSQFEYVIGNKNMAEVFDFVQKIKEK